MKIDEYVPDAIPTSSANAKSRRVSPPKSSSAVTGSSVQKLVASDRVSTSDIERLTICENAARGNRGTLSRTRSNTMIVSYSEYPRIVSSAATVAAVTSRPVSEYTPAVISRSCISAISTGTAYFHSKRRAMYAEITSSDAMIAMIALWAIVLPNVGPIEVEEKFLVPGTEALPNFASSALLISLTLSGRSVLVEI